MGSVVEGSVCWVVGASVFFAGASLPQAARLRTMTSTEIIAITFFILFFSFVF
jgi:hypothetical protein